MRRSLPPLVLLALLSSSYAWATQASFTAVATDGKTIVAGWKHAKPGHEPSTQIFAIEPGSASAAPKASALKLPGELRRRETVAILATEARLFVLSQNTIEQGDAPQLHVYDRVKRTWKKLGQADCPAFQELKTTPNALVLRCEDTTAEKPAFVDKQIGTGTEKLPDGLQIKLPETESRAGELKVSLEGEPFLWTKLRIFQGTQEHSLTAEKLGKK